MSKGIICIGSLLIDAYAFVEDKFLEKHNVEKGSAPILNPEKVKEIIKEVTFVSKFAGGSAANVIRGLGFLGHKTALVAQYGNDENGEFAKSILKEYGVTDLSSIKKNSPTTIINTLITPDAQRTMIALFSASHEERSNPLNLEEIDNYEYLMTEGYHFCNESLASIAIQAADYASNKNKKIIFMLSNADYVDIYRSNIEKVVEKSSIISGTSEEFLRMFRKENLDELLDFLEKEKKYEALIITLGSEGAYVIVNQKRYHLKPPIVEVITDTTGAGDFYTSGFLFGFINGYSLDVCSKIANVLAKNIISHVGVYLDSSVKKEVEEILKNEKE